MPAMTRERLARLKALRKTCCHQQRTTDITRLDDWEYYYALLIVEAPDLIAALEKAWEEIIDLKFDVEEARIELDER